ncbi:cysteine peptidase family C39 domain-containing protein [Arthrobacter bambusae]|jgi:hypothetical protein|uniref:cysteine peptidase family C39 domain-containing protein n=1 Tax=Arthrobacter bambusae TaxID=1338426 RepID=UPI0027887999|nr:cysteine peptidase family C39 domain-containing protein [Arthrobacter bambusae]MDQ0210349.1 hypothetical protein [Arthrobacter bambusae]MDQ0234798.1 hypothetical protein [Arthrobacter bambusae]
MPAAETGERVPFYSSMVSHDWEALGYPSRNAARFWDTRSCGVACLRMVYAQLLPGMQVLPATITEELLHDGAYTEQTGWHHAGLARHGQKNGLEADRLQFSTTEEFIETARGPGALIVSVGPSFESPGKSGHLAVLAAITTSSDLLIHRPSSHHPIEGRNIRLDPATFWDHFSGRAIHFRNRRQESGL